MRPANRCRFRPSSGYIPQWRWTASFVVVEETLVTHGPDFILGLCTLVGAVAGLAIGFYTGWFFPFAAAGLAAGLGVGAKLNPEDGEHPQH